MAWLWPFLRISALVTAAPVFGNRQVPARIRLGVALTLTLAIAPVLPPMPLVDPLSASAPVIAMQEVVIGTALGFALRLVYIVLEVGGQLIAQMMGLGFASLVDPQNGIDVPIVSQLYIMFATLLFLTLDGHLAIIEVLADSFVTLPVAAQGLGPNRLWVLVGQAGWVFSSAVRMALPAIAALFMVNLAFGVMTRAAPQLNIFGVGFPLTLMFGFGVILLTLPTTLTELGSLLDSSIAFARSMLSGGD